MSEEKKKAKPKKKEAPFEYATREELAKQYTDDDHKLLIEQEIDRPLDYTKMTMTRVTSVHWRINFWKTTRLEAGGVDSRIISSKFIKISVDSRGRLEYTDCTEGKLI